jgi:acetyltransferase EpsM
MHVRQKVAIWGASGHALVVADIIRLVGKFEIFGFIDDVNSVQFKSNFCGARIFGDQDYLEELKRGGVDHLIFGFGNCEARLRLAEISRKNGFSLASAVHPKATIAADVNIGCGTVIVAGAVVNSGTTIGENVIINTSATIDHECVIGDGVHICPGVHLAGKVTVGRATWVGIGTTVVDKMTIGANSVIGAGSLVIKNVPDNVMAYGVPAKVIKGL